MFGLRAPSYGPTLRVSSQHPGKYPERCFKQGQMLGETVSLFSCVGCGSIRGSTQEDSRAPGEEQSPARDRGAFKLGSTLWLNFRVAAGITFQLPRGRDVGPRSLLSAFFFPVALGWACWLLSLVWLGAGAPGSFVPGAGWWGCGFLCFPFRGRRPKDRHFSRYPSFFLLGLRFLAPEAPSRRDILLRTA